MGKNVLRSHTLEFLNPEWHYGENVTVRLGTKCASHPHPVMESK